MDSETNFRKKIYLVVARIPRGKVASYGLVAMLAGRPHAARAVGAAMRDVPEGLGLPCHRVIKSDGTLACKRIFGGTQRGLLEAEGVVFRPTGRVDMECCEWNGDRDCGGGFKRRRGVFAGTVRDVAYSATAARAPRR
jgi:methylated-DNA-protein-cysteine methyltransferase-like protein